MNKTRSNKINQAVANGSYFKDLSKMLVANSSKAEESAKINTKLSKVLKRLSIDLKWLQDNYKINK